MQSDIDFQKTTPRIEKLCASDHGMWEEFVRRQPYATFAHLPGISEAFKKAYGLEMVTLAAFRGSNREIPNPPGKPEAKQTLVGLLPMVHIRPLFFGNEFVSMPFLDTGGVLAQDRQARDALVKEALRIASLEGIRKLELRQTIGGSFQSDAERECGTAGTDDILGDYTQNTLRHKVRMILDLPETADILMQTFKSKLRSQILKAVRDDLTVKLGGLELLDHFYKIFCLNMRDLGSPVHSREFFETIIRTLPEIVHVLVVYQQNTPLAAGIVIGFGDCLYNPWASSLKAYKKLNANMLLYWRMLEFGCEKHFKYFDFGRSTLEEGTYRFKAQWGAVPQPLEWFVFTREASSAVPPEEKNKYSMAIHCWKKLPVGFTRWLGPKIRKHISL